jgi:hypothetical protein
MGAPTGGTAPVSALDAGTDSGIADAGVADGGSTLSDGGAPDGATDAGTADAGAGDASAPSPMCTTWCGCLELRCSTYSENPFQTVDECHAACDMHSAAELSCWTDFCERIPMSSAGLRMHLCEHAWGALGLDEC